MCSFLDPSIVGMTKKPCAMLALVVARRYDQRESFFNR